MNYDANKGQEEGQPHENATWGSTTTATAANNPYILSSDGYFHSDTATMSTPDLDDKIGAITQSLFSQAKHLRYYRGEVRNDELHRISSQAQLLARLTGSTDTYVEPIIDPNFSMMGSSERYPSATTAEPQFDKISSALHDPWSLDPYTDPRSAAILPTSTSHRDDMLACPTTFADISPSNRGQEMLANSPETGHSIKPFSGEAETEPNSSLSVVTQEVCAPLSSHLS
jgi:hypothetical protein